MGRTLTRLVQAVWKTGKAGINASGVVTPATGRLDECAAHMNSNVDPNVSLPRSRERADASIRTGCDRY